MGGWAPAPYERQPDGNHADLPGAGTLGDQAVVKGRGPAGAREISRFEHDVVGFSAARGSVDRKSARIGIQLFVVISIESCVRRLTDKNGAFLQVKRAIFSANQRSRNGLDRYGKIVDRRSTSACAMKERKTSCNFELLVVDRCLKLLGNLLTRRPPMMTR